MAARIILAFLAYFCRWIRQPKGHDKILKETMSCSEGRLGYIFSTNLDLVITKVETNLGEHLGSR
jgi:hypothetical protein